MARVGHRFGSIASVLALVGGMLFALAPAVAAATCEVTNAGADITFATLQEAVDDAASGDTLRIKGTCLGTTSIRRISLLLKGVPTAGQPTPTLDGDGIGRGLDMRNAKVKLRNLNVTNGSAPQGGGIRVGYEARLALAGTASITGNTAEFGGGIHNEGRVTLRGSSSVTGNVAAAAGGLFNGGTLVLNNASSVSGNTSTGSGGGIGNDGQIVLNGSASVTGNATGKSGGGIYNYEGTVTLNDSASVTGNTAATEGGGIQNGMGTVYTCSNLVAISPNDPDDPPETLPCTQEPRSRSRGRASLGQTGDRSGRVVP